MLTAHPTQVNRRTLQYKHTKIAHLLQQHDRKDLTQARALCTFRRFCSAAFAVPLYLYPNVRAGVVRQL